jgi:UDP-N-acetyl-D-galactosamine dehydrogenase
LRPLESASETVGRHLARGAVVVYESTVYPGVTEDICGPILERNSGLTAGKDFALGYSPERINPGDKRHNISSIVKVVAGQDRETTDLLAGIYGSVAKAGIHRAPDIRTAEAAKVIENIQRDLNIALVNELSIIFHRLGIDTGKVLEAAATKWNFLPFQPGLVGGHCIGVDPYYLTFKAQEVGYHPEVILAGRRINDYMGKYIAGQTIKELIKSGTAVKGSRILIMGFTFKENVKDVRNTRVIDIYNELKEYGVQPFIFDTEAEKSEVKAEYGIDLITAPKDSCPYEGIIAAVKHQKFSEFSVEYLRSVCNANPVLIDVKGVYDADAAIASGFCSYWRL